MTTEKLTPSQTDTPHELPRKTQRYTWWKRYCSLARAEIRQYLRNKTLLFMALIFPIGVGLLMQFVGPKDDAVGDRLRAGVSMEVFFFVTLMFVQFYSVLSMTTTRRDERVLKRLRTGEARDFEILAALATPGAVLSMSLTALMTVILVAFSRVTPITVVLLFATMALGIVMSTGLALLTSSFTANAEAAQMTSLPVMALAMISQSPLRASLPEEIQEPLARTPFAVLGDLVFIEWTGAPFIDAIGGDIQQSGGEILVSATAPLLMLLGWTVAIIWLALKYMKWETNR